MKQKHREYTQINTNTSATCHCFSTGCTGNKPVK